MSEAPEKQWGEVVETGTVQAPKNRSNGIRRGSDKQQNTLIVVENLYHIIAGQQPTGTRNSFSRALTSDEETWQRKFKVEQEWIPLQLGWLTDLPVGISVIYILNDEGHFNVIPTSEEKEVSKNKIVELKYADAPDDQCWTILPRESFRGQPLDCSKLRVRCRSGVARVSIIALPN